MRAVIGEYGFGKSHLVELAAQEALERNFLMAATSLDLGEMPAHSERSALFFLFTVTRSENRLPLESWLEDGQVLTLEPHYSA